MRWLKYLLICLLTLVVFGVGAAFALFIGDVRELLHLGERSRYFTLEIAQEAQVSYRQYEGRIYFETQKKGEAEQQALSSSISRTLGDIAAHIAKSSSCVPIPKSPISPAPSAQSLWLAVGSEYRCIITEQELPTYQSLLQEIDYLALKNGNLSLRVSALRPVVERAQIEEAKSSLRAALLDRARETVEFYTGQMGQHCALLTSKELGESSPSDEIRRALGGGYGGEVASAMPRIDAAIDSEIHLPLEKSAPLYLRAEITIRCDS